MFKKPFKVKSNSQLKGSDRKKLRSDILQQFKNLTEDELNTILPNKETVFQLKALTNSEVLVIVYTVQKLPIIFEVDKVMFPTVYTLWHVPDLLPTFTTHLQVLPVIARGADLMLPGVILPDGPSLHAYGKLQRGDRVSVNLSTNKAPVAVGRAAHSSYDMYMSAGRGKCVEVLHYYGDLLSTYGTKLSIPELGPAFHTDSDNIKNNIPPEPDAVETLAVNINTVDLTSSETDEINETYSELASGSSEFNPELEEENNSVKADISGCEMCPDELIKYCFFKSLKTTMKKVDLPLLTSNFYKLHMITACPNGMLLDIKKTSFKKLSNFLDEMVLTGVINTETLQKGVQSISKIDYSSELLKKFVDNFNNEADGSGLSVDTTQTNKSSVPEITEKYTVTAAVLPLFYVYDYKKKDAVTASVVRKVISDYVRVNNLQNSTNKKEVLLDPVLRSATGVPTGVDLLPWDQLVTAVFDQMGHSFKVELAGNETALTKGKLPPIDFHVGTRSGNKKVTLVNNLELYGINVAEFARECQHGVAASTTINSVPNAKSVQLQIQGNQVNFVAKILTEKYQIPKRYLRGLENAVKKKK